MRVRYLLLSLSVLGVVALVGGPALATTMYPDYNGTSVNFTGIQETGSFVAHPDPLFGAPTGVGNQLLFFPTNFTATSSGGGSDATGANLQMTLTATGGNTLQQLLIDEFGDNSLTGTGTAATGTYASMSGFITVLADINGPIAPVIIGFNAGGLTPVNGYFNPVALGYPGLDLVSNPGTILWDGHVAVDISSIVPNATLATISFDNDLYAYSEAGTTAKIQKKVVSGPAVIITVIPEPGTLALLGGGLLALALRARGRRA